MFLVALAVGAVIGLVVEFARAAASGNVTNDPELQAALDARHASK